MRETEYKSPFVTIKKEGLSDKLICIHRDNFKRIIIAGAAGSGKDYLKDKFFEEGFPVDVSYTTRPQRDGEVPGYTYNYVSKFKFRLLKFFGRLKESVKFNNAFYGTSKSCWRKSIVFIMTPSGISQISKKDLEDCVILYLDIDEDVRRERISKRSDGGFDKTERRIQADNKDFKGFWEKADYVICDPKFSAGELINELLSLAYKG